MRMVNLTYLKDMEVFKHAHFYFLIRLLLFMNIFPDLIHYAILNADKL